MDATDGISSTWENEKRSNDQVCSENLRYDCDSETEYGSEDETIDVLCENSKLSVARLRAKNQRGPSICTNERIYFDQSGTTCSTKTLNPTRSFCNNSEYTNSVKNINISKSKTFLIDSILGNNKSDSNQIDASLCNDDSNNFEETTDEHNGK